MKSILGQIREIDIKPKPYVAQNQNPKFSEYVRYSLVSLVAIEFENVVENFRLKKMTLQYAFRASPT